MSQYINRRSWRVDAGVHLVAAKGRAPRFCGELVDSEAMIESKSRVVTCHDRAASTSRFSTACPRPITPSASCSITSGTRARVASTALARRAAREHRQSLAASTAVPDAVLHRGEHSRGDDRRAGMVEPTQIKEFQLWWDSLMEGTTAQRRHREVRARRHQAEVHERSCDEGRRGRVVGPHHLLVLLGFPRKRS